jgi:diguanylate cyclase (GGDEF)-like protein/PAS domain S-box-containing protein
MNTLRQMAEQRLGEVLGEVGPAPGMEDDARLLHDLRVHQIELEMQNEELRNTQAVLSASRDRFSHLYNFSPVSYCTLDTKGIVLECNLTLCQLLNRERSELIGYPLGRNLPPEDVPILQDMFSNREPVVENTLRLRSHRKDTPMLHVLLRLQRLEKPIEGAGHWLAAISDITSLHHLTEELRIKSAAIENTLEGVLITRADGKICFVNDAFEKTTGYTQQQVLGKNPNILHSGKHTAAFYQDMWQAIIKDGHWRGEVWNRRANGEIYPEWLSISSILDTHNKPAYYVAVFSDITTEENMRQRLHKLAYYDGVTDLPNRHLFMDRLRQAIADARRNNRKFALLFIDLDRFKNINDTLGHSTGDLLLVEVSRRIASNLREVDTVARMGGDEFMILLPNIQHDKDSLLIANKLLGAMADPFNLEGRQYHISASIGISHFPADGTEAEDIIRHADIAMYQAKAQGRNTYHRYTGAADEKQAAHLDLENDLRHAVRLNSLDLHYQLQKNLTDGCWSGVEALLRWNHPERGFISPADFIPIAEETGLIVDIGYWVLRRACKQFIAWRREGLEVGRISINLSPHQFLQSNLVERMREILEETGMSPHHLGVEITESAAMPNFLYSVRTLEALREMGVAIYIDDFGTGFSSLSHLRRLPIDILKIDRSFVAETPGHGDDVAIVRAIIAMARAMNIEIVAEGIEDGAQLEFLRTEGCHAGQGFLLSKPVPAAEVTRLMKETQPEVKIQDEGALAHG